MSVLTAAALATFAATQVFRLELDTETDIPSIVGVDGVRREVCLVSPAEYAMLTGRVEQVWKSLNSTEAGRIQLHGDRINQSVDDNTHSKVTTYADGYRHFDPMTIKAKARATQASKPAGEGAWKMRFGEAHRRFRQELDKRKTMPVKSVTIEHDAASGRDVVK